MAYADFTYYQNTYLGNAIADTAFPQLALRASAVIDRITFNRATAETDVDNINSIKMAMCAVAEELQRQDSTDGADGIVSESQGQYSVSYAATSSRTLSNNSKLENAARLWLDNTYLMFSGFFAGEYGGTVDT
jgi:hypothetical protein